MNWSFDETKNVWSLNDGASVISRIFIKEKPNQVNCFIVKTLLPSIYVSSAEFKKLTQVGKNWYSMTRKFNTKEKMLTYIEMKKSAVYAQIERV